MSDHTRDYVMQEFKQRRREHALRLQRAEEALRHHRINIRGDVQQIRTLRAIVASYDEAMRELS